MITLDIPKGCTIYEAAKEACAKANEIEKKVAFIFNDICLIASPKSYYYDICDIYILKGQIRRLELQ